MGPPDPRTEKSTKEDLEQQVDWKAVHQRRRQLWAFQMLMKVEAAPVAEAEWTGQVDVVSNSCWG